MSLTLRFEEQQSGKVLKVHLGGSLDTQTAPDLDSQLEPRLRAPLQMLVFDMQELEYISSAGLRSVFKASKSVKQLGGKLGVANRQPQIVKVFEIVKALPDLNIFRTTAEMDEYLTTMQRQVTDPGL